MDNYNGCCFFGPRNMEFSDKLKQEVMDLIDEFVLCQCVGNIYFQDVKGFEEICRTATFVITQVYGYINRYKVVPRAKTNLALPMLTDKDKKKYDKLCIVHMSDACYKEKERFTQYEMIQKSDFCIFYIDNMTQTDLIDLYKYARLHKRFCINLGSFRNEIVNR